MPPRYVRARLEPGDPKINIRRRYMEAIRNGATIEDATHYANGETDVFLNTAPVVETAPQAGYGKPGEGEQTLPLSWTTDGPPKKLPAVDESAESFKRPLSAAPAPVSPPAAVSPPAEKPPAAATKPKFKPPPDWDAESFPWPKLRALTMAMGLPTPNNRPDAVRSIRGRIAADAQA